MNMRNWTRACCAGVAMLLSPAVFASAQEEPCAGDCGAPDGGYCVNTYGTQFRGNQQFEYATNPNRVRSCDYRGTPIAVECYNAQNEKVSTVVVVYWDDKQCAGWVPY